MNDFLTIKELLLDGVEFQYGKLTLCDLSKYSDFRGLRRYQVFCDDPRNSYFNVFLVRDVDKAVAKFLELKNKIDSKIRFYHRRRENENF